MYEQCWFSAEAQWYFQVSSLNHKVASIEGYKTSLQNEAECLKDANKQLNQEKHQLEIRLNEMKAEARGMAEKVR